MARSPRVTQLRIIKILIDYALEEIQGHDLRDVERLIAAASDGLAEALKEEGEP
jgi:hypothetical protein